MLEDVYNTQHACISLVVTDDDSSTEANYKHSWQACIDSDDHPMEESDWPRSGTNNTKKRTTESFQSIFLSPSLLLIQATISKS